MHTLDHVQAESEIQAEQAQAEAPTNLDWDQGKPQYIRPSSLTFILN
jgi:hypothetical protein